MAHERSTEARHAAIRCELWDARRALATFCATTLCRFAMDSEEQNRLLHCIKVQAGEDGRALVGR